MQTDFPECVGKERESSKHLIYFFPSASSILSSVILVFDSFSEGNNNINTNFVLASLKHIYKRRNV